MKSNWEKFDSIRVVDAGYLLANLEPVRKWQFAPPLVKSFYSLIREKTGAVTFATMPGERMEITKTEFQKLKTEYGIKPVDAPATVASNDDAEGLAEREFTAAFSEVVNNGIAINWRYWVHQLPALTAGEAARLMCGLDPDLFKSLENRPNKNDQTELCKKAAMIQRLAEREGMESATPSEWIAWADQHQIAVHDGFTMEVASVAPILKKAAPVVTASASGGVELQPASQPKANAATGPLFSMARTALVSKHLNNWPTIDRDLRDAAANGLSAAKAGKRDWNEADALAWAEARGKRQAEKRYTPRP